MVNGAFTDQVGNKAVPVDAPELLHILSRPLPVTLSAAALSTFEIELSWTISESNDFSAYRIYRSFSQSVTDTSWLAASIANKNTGKFTDTTLNDDSTYYYRIYVFDNTGLSAGSNVAGATTFTNSAPDSVVLIGSNEADPNIVNLSWTKSAEYDFESYRIYRNRFGVVTPLDELNRIIGDRNTLNYDSFLASDADTIDDTFYYRIYVYDRHGLFTGSNEIMVVR